MKIYEPQKTCNTNYDKIVQYIRKCCAKGASPHEIKNEGATKLSRKTIHKYLKEAVNRKDIVKHRCRYFSREFEDRKLKAEEAYREILGFTEEDLNVRAGLPWFGRSDFTLTQFPPEKYLDSGKLIHTDILRSRSKLGDKKRAKLEALNYTDAFLKNVKVEIGSSIKEVKLQSGHRITKIAAFLPFVQKVEKGWDTEVYDKAAWIMYRFFREIVLPSPKMSPSDEITISIRLNPYGFMIRLFNAMYTFKKLEDWQHTNVLKGSHFRSIFPELQKTDDYQAFRRTI